MLKSTRTHIFETALQSGLRPRTHETGYKQLCGFKNFRIRMDEALILETLKVKQTPKLIALPLSDTQIGTKTNKQKANEIILFKGVDHKLYFFP